MVRNRFTEQAMAHDPVKPVPQGPKAVGALAVRVTGKAFERHGLPNATLLADWAAIAGAELAQFCRPEKLIAPRRVPAQGGASNAPQGATLVLRVEGPRAIEIQHLAPQLIERLNSYLGYRAIGRLRIEQGPIGDHSRAVSDHHGFEEESAPYDTGDLDAIEDEGLRSALARLGGRIR